MARDTVEKLKRIFEDRRVFKFIKTRGSHSGNIHLFESKIIHLCCQAESWIYDLNV